MVNDSSEQEGGDFRTNLDKTHSCGSIYQKLFEWLTWPLKLLKKFLKSFPIPYVKNGRPTTTTIYDLFKEFADENRDYVLLFKVAAAIITLVIMYFLYQQFFFGRLGLGLDLDLISDYLWTMNTSDLPMSAEINAKMEAEALNCWSRYFSSVPYSFENAGLYDLVRGVVLAPFVYIFFSWILPIFLIYYVFWFLYYYVDKVIAAIAGAANKALWFFTEKVICEISGPVPFFSYSCPDFTETFTDWRREYVDEPIYEERLKYLRDFYLAKLKIYDRPWAYLERLWRRGRVQSDFNNKFLTRSKQVFYEKMLDSQAYVDNLKADVSIGVNRIGLPMPTLPTLQAPSVDGIKTGLKSGLDNATQVFNETYKNRTVIYSLLTLVSIILLVLIFVGYSLTGCPDGVYEWIGPLWRFIKNGSALQFVSSNYNWLAIGSVILLILTLFGKLLFN